MGLTDSKQSGTLSNSRVTSRQLLFIAESRFGTLWRIPLGVQGLLLRSGG